MNIQQYGKGSFFLPLRGRIELCFCYPDMLCCFILFLKSSGFYRDVYIGHLKKVTALPPLVLLEEFIQGWKTGGRQLSQCKCKASFQSYPALIPSKCPYNILTEFKMAASELEEYCVPGCY